MQDVIANLEIEKSLLATLMIYNELFDPIAEILTPECFYNTINGDVFRTMRSLYDEGIGFKSTTVSARLQQEEEKSDKGKRKLRKADDGDVAMIMQAELFSGNEIVYNAKILRELYQRREISTKAQEISFKCKDLSSSSGELLNEIQSLLNGLLDQHDSAAEFVTMKETMEIVFRRIADNLTDTSIHMGMPTGFRFIDEVGGLERSCLALIAGRPSNGKSAIAMQWAVHAARNNWKVAFISLEMTNEQLSARTLAMESSVPGVEIRHRALDERKMALVNNARESLHNSGILDRVIFKTKISARIDSIVTDIRRLHRKGKVDVVFIDYLQQILPDAGRRARGESEATEIGDNVQTLQLLAKELNIVIVLLSQLNRQSTLTGDGRPRLSETRGSGRIEECIDYGFVVHAPEVDGNGKNFGGEYSDVDTHNTIMMIQAKSRNGAAGHICFMHFEKELTKVIELDSPPRYSGEKRVAQEYGDLFED